mmetsp:Transcript_24465/g.76701  ORF Transcript_24465/g.76701 Transcript_24465/m.76701 type:complete len:190 (-) Transcript_24465:137-706(-)
MTSCAQAIRDWETKNESKAEEAETVHLYCQIPPISKLDNSLNSLAACKMLSLSTNSIDRLIPLSGMSNLTILSLGRNVLKKIEKLDDCAGSLEQLWASYNNISTLDGLANLQNLTTLYLANNKIGNWDELEKLKDLPNLRDVLLVGNPIYEDLTAEEIRLNVLRRLPNLQKIDGDMVTPAERDAALAEA